MAKGKHAAALFEVIHTGKQIGGRDRVAGLLSTPKWWFNSRKKQHDPAPAETASQEVPDAPATASAEPPAPRPPAVDLLVDSQRHQITFRVSYTSAIVTAFSVLVVVALAYLVGRNMARGPAQAMGGPSSEQIRQGPARPEVMDVGRGGTQGSSRSTPEPDVGISSNNPSRPSPTQIAQPRIAGTSETGRRIQGQNYVVIQSYPDEASAKAAVDVLQQNGVGSTIEKGLRGMKSDWYIVVGTEGFARIRSTEFEAYLRKIQQISDKFASKKSFKAFEPFGYKWDRP